MPYSRTFFIRRVVSRAGYPALGRGAGSSEDVADGGGCGVCEGGNCEVVGEGCGDSRRTQIGCDGCGEFVGAGYGAGGAGSGGCECSGACQDEEGCKEGGDLGMDEAVAGASSMRIWLGSVRIISGLPL